jgi:hypothetical protein
LPDGTLAVNPTHTQGKWARASAEAMIVVAPPGETWDANGNEEALVRNPHGVATYSKRDIKVVKPKRRPESEPQPKVESQPEPEPEPQPKPEPQPEPRPKKKHKRFTSPAPDIGDDGVKAYQEKLECLLNDALPEARASMGSPRSEQNPKTDDVQDYQNALVDSAPSSEPALASMAPPPWPQKRRQRQQTPESPQASMSPPPRPKKKRQERQRTPESPQALMSPPPRPKKRKQARPDTPETERRQGRQDNLESERRPEKQDSPRPEPKWEGMTEAQYKHYYRWKVARRIGDDYIPTARELARVITVPKRPSPLSQVQNAESDVSTTASSSPPRSPRLNPNTASNIEQRTPEGRRRYMEWLSNQPPSLPRAGDRGLGIVYHAPPQQRQESPKQMIQAPDQTPQACHERIWRWKDFVRRYHVIGNRPTSRELAQVIVVPKKTSLLSQVHNVDSDMSTTPTSSPPHSPRLRPRAVVTNSFRSFEETLRHMDDLDDKPARDRCLPRPRDPELKIVYRAPPEKEVKIIGWQLSNGMHDVCYLIQLVGSPSAPL